MRMSTMSIDLVRASRSSEHWRQTAFANMRKAENLYRNKMRTRVFYTKRLRFTSANLFHFFDFISVRRRCCVRFAIKDECS